MINTKINKVTAEGDNIFVFQYIDSTGNKTEEKKSFEEFLQPFTKDLNDKIELLNNRLSDQLKTVADKEKIEQLIDKENLQLTEKIQQLEEEKKQLTTQIEHFLSEVKGKELSETTELYQEAFDLFIEGKVDDALEVLDDAKLEEEEKIALENLKQKAETRILKARMLEIKHKYEEASENYIKAGNLFASWKICIETANHFSFINEFEKAEKHYRLSLEKTEIEHEEGHTLFSLAVLYANKKDYEEAKILFEKALNIYSNLLKTEPKKYVYDIINIINGLANIHTIKNEFEKAEVYYNEALNICNSSTQQNSMSSLSQKALILMNLGDLLSQKNNLDKAEKLFIETLEIYRYLKIKFPKSFLNYLSGVLLKLGMLYDKMNQFEKAKEVIQESLVIKRELVKENPKTYLHSLGMTLNNLGTLLLGKKLLDDAEKIFLEALGIFEKLIINSTTYQPEFSLVLNNLVAVYSEKGKTDQIESLSLKAVRIRRELVKQDSKTYLSLLATSLNNLALYYEDMKKFNKAEELFFETLEIYKNLAVKNPQVFIPKVGFTLMSIGTFYQQSKINREVSIKYIDESITYLFPFSNIPYVFTHLSSCFAVLTEWNINVEEFVKKKFNR